MSDPLVIYHGNCIDGFGSAFVLWRWGGLRDAEFVGGIYGQSPPDVLDRDVWVVDFSYPRDELIRMNDRAESLTLLDHHKTAEEDLAGLPFCRFEPAMSGAGLTWRHLLPDEPVHWMIDAIEDNDLWRFTIDGSKEVYAALESYPMELGIWNELADAGRARLLEEGKVILRYRKRLIERIVQSAEPIELLGYRGAAVRTSVLVSDVCAHLYENEPVDFACAIFRAPDGRFVVGLRSSAESGTDVSEIARHFGGGGHRNSAGFRTREDPLGDE